MNTIIIGRCSPLRIAGHSFELLLFEIGLDASLADLMKVGASSLLEATVGVVLPFVFGWFASAWLLPDQSYYVHTFIGATLCATSVGITARVLQDIGAIGTREAPVRFDMATSFSGDRRTRSAGRA